MKKKLMAILLILAAVCSMALPAYGARPTHGTTNNWITEDMLTTAAPADYRIDPATQGDAMDGRYNAYFLKDRLQTVSIQIDENNLNYLLQNATKEEYVMTNAVTIGDTTFGYCGLRTKGNFTLHHAYTDNPGSDRFSFTVDFNQYVSKELFGQGQNFYGCDRISFNNFYFDKSMLKEYYSFMLLEEMGLPTPQFGLAKLYINGDYYGVFFMVEAMDESVLEQYFGVKGSQLSSYLCKPTGTRLRYEELMEDLAPLYEYDLDTYEKVKDMIPTVRDWVRRLNLLAGGKDFDGNAIDVNSAQYLELLAQVMDIEETVKYFAVHSWLCQTDDMFVNLQNYGLYISPQGVSTVLPWDYDLAFGCYFPSTAENTANYPVDVMYQLNPELWGNESKHSADFYKIFPLFYVIYQNEELMEKYHEYMLDCSRIAALGGTVSSGKVYDPGWFNALAAALEEPLTDAAEEKLASNVYYMNGIRQPRDVKNALPNITRMVALRAVGVYNQITGTQSWVCGSGCNLESIGNALNVDSTKEGRLTVIDSATGIFITADFEGGRRTPVPVLAASRLTEKDKDYQTVLSLMEPGFGQKMLAYSIKSSVKATSDYLLTIPLPADYVKNGATYHFYLLSGKTLVPLQMSQKDNLFTCLTSQVGTVVVLADIPVLSASGDDLLGIIVLATAAAAIAAIGIGVHVSKKRKKA